MHWRLDVILDEDHSRSHGNSIDNLSLIRKIVFNLTKLDNSVGTNLTLKKKMTRYTSDFKNIENLIFQVIPLLNCLYVKFLCGCHILFVDNFIDDAGRILPPDTLT